MFHPSIVGETLLVCILIIENSPSPKHFHGMLGWEQD
jgi:hypothetical protein